MLTFRVEEAEDESKLATFDQLHYTINELVARWGFSRDVIIKEVDRHMGKFPVRSNAGSGKRIFRSRRIPASVAKAAHDALCTKVLEQEKPLNLEPLKLNATKNGKPAPVKLRDLRN